MNLLNLDVDAVFEQHNINEIDVISRKIQSEIESKKEELRTMVGERYRDLIQAADTIAEMKETSASLSANIISLQSKEQSSEFKSGSEKQKITKKKADESVFSTVVQIKILTILPELIWSRIDDDDFFVATQLFIFSRHISTGLKLDVDLMSNYPVAKKQWELLAPFFYTIKQQCLQTLERENLTSEVASKCLASLLLLENCQLEKLLTTFLQTRAKTFQKTVSGEDFDLVKEKLLKSMRILMTTVKIVHECFIGDKTGGLLAMELKKISGENSQPTLSLLEKQKSAIFETLPDIIAKYKPQVFCNELGQDAMKNSMSSWIKTVEKIAQNQLKSLIKLIGSIKTIQDIHQQMQKDEEKPSNWTTICQNLFLPESLDFFKQFYQSLINERIQDIINIFWVNILRELSVDVEGLTSDNEKFQSDDLQRYVWTDDPSDNPLSLKDALSNVKSSHQLLMKVRGFTTSIVDLCNKIDGSLEKLFKDLENYLANSSENQEFRRMKTTDPDHQKVVLYLKDCSRENISTLITTIKSSKFNRTAENLLTLARLLQAISELCPNLQACFSGHLLLEPNYLRDPDDSNVDEWKSVCGLLEEESLQFWSEWFEMFINSWNKLDHKIDVSVILKDFPCWESITIEEKDESENVVQSQIHVPSQISLSIHCWTYEIIGNLNKIIPHTLPKLIHTKIVDRYVETIYEHYETLSKDDFVNGSQKTAWQFFFDVKVLTLLFISRDNKKWNEKFQTLASHFKSIIDPFDFDVFYQHVSVNIKKNAARIQHGVACLIPNMEHLNNILANQNVTSSHDKDPNILMMSSSSTNVTWFPLLPVITTKETAAVVDIPKKEERKPQQKSGGNVVKKQPMQTSSSSSTLSSLQDWFR